MIDLTTTQDILTQNTGAVRTLTLNRADKLNSFTRELHTALSGALSDVACDASVRCVVITGAGRGFCAGQDLADMNMTQPVPAQLQDLVGNYFNPLIRKLHAFPKPIVMAVNGIAAGAGANLALAGDICIAKQSASFLQAFVHIGLIPDSGGTYFLPRAIGTARALAAAMLGEKMSAQAAMDAGMIYQAVADDSFDAAVQATAQKLAAMPTQALVAIRQSIRHGGSLDTQLDIELDLQTKMAATADCAEGVGAFLAKRKAVFTGL